MASIKTYKFPSTTEGKWFLDGALVAGLPGPIDSMGRVFGIVGKKITFVKPTAATVTFVDGSIITVPGALSLGDIAKQLRDGVTNLNAYFVGGKLVLQDTTLVNGIQFNNSGANDDARALLGISSKALHTKIYADPSAVTTPRLVSVDAENGSNTIIYSVLE